MSTPCCVFNPPSFPAYPLGYTRLHPPWKLGASIGCVSLLHARQPPLTHISDWRQKYGIWKGCLLAFPNALMMVDGDRLRMLHSYLSYFKSTNKQSKSKHAANPTIYKMYFLLCFCSLTRHLSMVVIFVTVAVYSHYDHNGICRKCYETF